MSQILHHCCQVLSVLVGLHSIGLVAVDLKPSNLLLEDNDEPPHNSSNSVGVGRMSTLQQQGLVLADAQLHLIMAGVLREAWPSEAALADPYYK